MPVRNIGIWASSMVCGFMLGGLAFAPLAARGAIISKQLTIDQVLIEDDPGRDYSKLKPEMTMSYDDTDFSVLTLRVTNATTESTGGTDAGNVLTGVALDLPEPLDILASGSTIVLTAGSSVVTGDQMASTATLNDDRWGFINSREGHFDTVGNLLLVDTVISTNQSDVNKTGGSTFAGNVPANVLLDQTDWGLLSSVLTAQGTKDFVNNSLTFTLKLNSTFASTILDTIDAGPVSVEFGSPAKIRSDGGAAIPEPSTLIVWSLLGALGFTVQWWRRRRRRLAA